ncbi:MAG TPA: diphosphate--fructose-6-phosphate 1-phosphotransferase [Anaerolineae bacterium]|nr:diphosphate--fructose-6-phosphate 1-phosphotransferase [Anaerolineae bacterium]
MTTKSQRKRLAILVGGGPAPGLNGVIHSATIEAIRNGMDVFGIYEGYKYLMQGQLVGEPLTINKVSRIYRDGGSILFTSRANPTKKPEYLECCAQKLVDEGINYLVSIGGDDTAFSAYSIARYAKEQMGVPMQIVHAPKTIDNDLPLPEGIPTFGFETAREVGTRLVMNLMEDARTSQRWYLAVAMGRSAGHLALGIGKSSGATITVIPEEWGQEKVRLQEVLDTLAGSVIKRLADDKQDGVAVIAEGLMEHMDEEDMKQLSEDIPLDEHGHIRMAEVNFAERLKAKLSDYMKTLGVKNAPTFVNIDIGYVLRCADPIAFDIDYTRSLGQAAVQFLLQGGSDAIMTIQENKATPIPFVSLMNPQTGRTAVRLVNINSFTYQSARNLMIRLEPEDAEDATLLSKMVGQTQLTLEEFKQKFGYLIGIPRQAEAGQ